MPAPSEYVSEDLYHFVGRSNPDDHECNYETLLKVVRQGCVSHRPHQPGWGSTSLTINWNQSILSEELVVPSVTCFCDIPFDHLQIHVAKYGCFGLAFDREFLIRYGARPVSYVPLSPEDWRGPFGATLLTDVECVFRAFRKLVIDGLGDAPKTRSLGREPSSPEAALGAVESILGKDFLAFIKPFDSTLPAHHKDNFYMEREWRRFGNLCFGGADIRRIVVEAAYMERAQNDVPELAHLLSPISMR